MRRPSLRMTPTRAMLARKVGWSADSAGGQAGSDVLVGPVRCSVQTRSAVMDSDHQQTGTTSTFEVIFHDDPLLEVRHAVLPLDGPHEGKTLIVMGVEERSDRGRTWVANCVEP